MDFTFLPIEYIIPNSIINLKKISPKQYLREFQTDKPKREAKYKPHNRSKFIVNYL